MKKINLLLSFALLSFAGMAQTPTGTAQEVIIPAGETIAHCDAMIQAIDTKVQYVLSHEDEKARAEQSGWFDKMARNRALFVARRAYLINHPESPNK